jgi:hypothetical protein
MQRFTFICCTAVLASCGRPADRTADEQPAMDTAAPATRAASISLADVAGKWKLRSTDEAGGTPVEVEMVATADTSGWSLTGPSPNKKPIPVRVVAVEGDSIVTESGPYESFIRKGVQVRTRTVSRLQGDKLVGTVEARYTTKSGDSVVQRRTEGTRAE